MGVPCKSSLLILLLVTALPGVLDLRDTGFAFFELLRALIGSGDVGVDSASGRREGSGRLCRLRVRASRGKRREKREAKCSKVSEGRGGNVEKHAVQVRSDCRRYRRHAGGVEDSNTSAFNSGISFGART